MFGDKPSGHKHIFHKLDFVIFYTKYISVCILTYYFEIILDLQNNWKNRSKWAELS